MAEITSQEILRRLVNLESKVQQLSVSIEKVSKAGAKRGKGKSTNVASAATVDTPIVGGGVNSINRAAFNVILATFTDQINNGFQVLNNLIKNIKSGGAR